MIDALEFAKDLILNRWSLRITRVEVQKKKACLV